MRMARPKRLSLRARLLWTFLIPLAFVLVLVGVVSTAKLRDQLVGQVDTRLTSALSRSAHADGGYLPPPGGPTVDRRARDSGRPLHIGFVDDQGHEVAVGDVEFARTANYPSAPASGV